jgi:hypothetical protein
MDKSNISDKELKILLRRIKAHIKNSKDFKNSILLLLKEEEGSLLFKNFNTPHPDSKRPLSELLMTEKNQFSELEKKAISVVCNLLEQIEEDFKEIELLQGMQREIRVREFKQILIERLVRTSSVSLLMNSDYTKLFEKEMKKYISLK